ncbi:MAG: UDP-galactopyranose mutase [Eubacterium sp.]|nr:UDP-galactopyranose mutase [Eubacterium sp.]
MEYDVIIAGCGLSGAVCARELADIGKRVIILERRDHIGGNMYDYTNKDGILVHKYGPHTFHTNNQMLYEYMCRYSEWNDYRLTCGAVMNGKYSPVPFNFDTIDIFYGKEKAKSIQHSLRKAYPDRKTVPVLELLQHSNPLIREYAEFLYENDYSLYTAKQWGVAPKEISPGVLKRVPVRLDNRTGYFEDTWQVMPEVSYADFYAKLLDSPNIEVRLNTDARSKISLDETSGSIRYNGKVFQGYVIYTGPTDELFQMKYGSLPYRSLKFVWKTEQIKSFQMDPVVAYPQAEGYTRITEYTKLPVQDVGNITVYAIEYPVPYKEGKSVEPYYPVLTDQSQKQYQKYRKLADRYKKLYLCGRLADFQYYNMDQALEKALHTADKIKYADREGS